MAEFVMWVKIKDTLTLDIVIQDMLIQYGELLWPGISLRKCQQ